MTCLALAGIIAALTLACSPEVGSDAWCEEMRDTPKGDWSANEASAYLSDCAFK
jgi:hypothetical protein